MTIVIDAEIHACTHVVGWLGVEVSGCLGV
jgi:hypothetical protein